MLLRIVDFSLSPVSEMIFEEKQSCISECSSLFLVFSGNDSS